jgi:dUTP pyrophosphatase
MANVIKLKKVDKNAIVPQRATDGSVGYDLTAIKLFKKVSENTFLYDTGIQIAPPAGYYTEIVPRSSLIKTGYMLANSVGVIDSDYRGNLMIALTKVDQSAPDLELPFTKCQLLVRKEEISYSFEEVESLKDTTRGCGGFGSTDKK